jgi:hypothetical protein
MRHRPFLLALASGLLAALPLAGADTPSDWAGPLR